MVTMKVSTRLSLGFALALLVLAALMLVGLFRFNNIGVGNSKIIDKDWAKAQAVNILSHDNAYQSLGLLVVIDNSVGRCNHLTFLPPML